MQLKPRFGHDCPKCQFLGQTHEFDFYVCEGRKDKSRQSLIARYGENGEYLSFARDTVERAPEGFAEELKIALAMVKQLESVQ